MQLDWLRNLVGPAGGLDDRRPAVSERELSDRAAAYLERTAAERGEAIVELAGLMAAAHAELLDLVAASDAAGDWVDDGATDMAAWLVAACGLSTGTAREWVRVADALQPLPALRDEYAKGRLSWDQVRPASWFVTPDVDHEAAASLPGLSARQLDQLSRRHRPRTTPDANAAHARRRLQIRADHRNGGFRYSAFLPADQGAAVNAELLARAEAAGKDPATDKWDPLPTRLADALHDLATGTSATASGESAPDPDATCVVIHAEARDLEEGQTGNGTIGELALHPEGVLRALCDCRVEVALHDGHGRTVGIGRASRKVPWWLRRTVHRRDLTCRFTGCERPIRHMHHIVHWTGQDGPTDADNLVGLCWAHHRLVHEGGWSIEGDPEAELTFVSPGGRRLHSRPQPLSPEVRHLLGQHDPPPGDPP